MSGGGATTHGPWQDVYGIGPQGEGPHLPPWIPPPQNPNAGRGDINDTSMEHSRRYATVSAEGTILPIIYGEDFIGPIISLAKVVGSDLYLRCVWCMGEIESIVKVISQEGDLPPSTVMTHYLGTTTQGVDPTLAAAIPGYTDTCIVDVAGQKVGVAYSVIKIPASQNQSFPRLIARIKGRKIRDPRGYNFYPNAPDGDFNQFFISNARIPIGYNGTAHTYGNGSNKRGTNASAFIGSDQSKGVVTLVMRRVVDNASKTLLDIGNGKFRVYIDSDKTLRVTGKNAANTTVLDAKTTTVTGLVPNAGSAYVISFDLTVPRVQILENNVDVLAGGSTVTSGQTVNVSAGGWAVGGDYASGAVYPDADISGLTVYFGNSYDLTLATSRTIFFDGLGRLLNFSLTYTPQLMAWDGWVVAAGFAYGTAPVTLNDCGSNWTTSGTPSFHTYFYQGVNGGLYVYWDGTGTPVKLTVSPGLAANLHSRLYAHVTDASPTGELAFKTSTAGAELFRLSQMTPEAVMEYTTSDDNYSITIASAFSGVMRQYYIFPAPKTWENKFPGIVADVPGIGSGWYGTGTVSQADAVRLGLQSASCDISWVDIDPLCHPGEYVDWLIEIDGTFTGSVEMYLTSSLTPTRTFTEVGAYSGRDLCNNVMRLKINCSVGNAIVWRVKTIANTIYRKWTASPAAHLADLLESPVYGLGGDVNDSYFLQAVNYNEELVTLESSTEKRHQCGITLAQQQSVESWIETLRGYARCFIAVRDGEYLLVPDKPSGGTGIQIIPEKIVAGTLKLTKKSLLNLPNVVKIYFTQTALEPWTEDVVEVVHPNVTTGTEYRRETSLRMSGIQSRSMAYRYAVERLNYSTLLDLEGSVQTKDILWPLEVGDVCSVFHPLGLDDKSIRILSCDPVTRGSVNITFIEYDPNVYSNAVVAEPPPPDYQGQTPFNPPPITGLTLSETFYISGNSTRSQLVATWADPNYAFLQYYSVEIYENGVKVQTLKNPDRTVYFRDLVVGATYMVVVKFVTTAFVAGLPASATLVAQGKNLPPDFSTGQIVAFEVGDGISAYVRQPATDIDLWGYEWRYREVTQNNLFADGGLLWVGGNWTTVFTAPGDGFTMGYKSAQLVTTDQGQLRITCPITGLVAGKKYDVYVKFKGLSNGQPVTYGGAALWVSMPGATSGGTSDATKQVYFDTGSKPGTYKFTYTPTSGDLSGTPKVTIDLAQALTSTTYTGTLEFIAIRENPSNITTDWDNAIVFERKAGTQARLEQVPTGYYVVYCKALDSTRSPANPYGQYSTVTQGSSTSVYSDAGSYFKFNYKFSLGTLTREGLWPQPTNTAWSFKDGSSGADVLVGTLVPDGGATFNATFGSNINSYGNPIASYAKSAGSSHIYESGTYDLGTSLRGAATVVFGAFKITDDPLLITWNLLYKVNSGDSWTVANMSIGASTNFSGRYVAVRATVPANKSIGIKCNSESFLDIVAIPRVETGSITSLGPDGSGNPQPVTVTLENIYSAVISAKAWVSTTEAIEAYCDNITFGATSTTFTIVALNLRGQPVAATVNWEFKGV